MGRRSRLIVQFIFGVFISGFLITSGASCNRNDPDSASDEDILKAGFLMEDSPATEKWLDRTWRQMERDNPVQYHKEVEAYRQIIRKSGCKTLAEYVQKEKAREAQAKATEDRRRKEEARRQQAEEAIRNAIREYDDRAGESNLAEIKAIEDDYTRKLDVLRRSREPLWDKLPGADPANLSDRSTKLWEQKKAEHAALQQQLAEIEKKIQSTDSGRIDAIHATEQKQKDRREEHLQQLRKANGL